MASSAASTFYYPDYEMQNFLHQLVNSLSDDGRPNLHKSISITWVSYAKENPLSGSGIGAGWLDHKLFYPASVIKLFYACAVEVWLHRDLLVDSLELRRALSDMIVHSSNDATSYIVDLLTGSTSGPSLVGERWEAWKIQRYVVNKWLQSLSWPESSLINCCQKTWGDGPYGRDKDFYGDKNSNRNKLNTVLTARMLEALMTDSPLLPKGKKRLLGLFSRSLDIEKRKNDPENQIDGFLGEGLPLGTKLWSKAGFMSEVRHDAAWFITPQGNSQLLVVFCEGKKLAKDHSLLPLIALNISQWNSKK